VSILFESMLFVCQGGVNQQKRVRYQNSEYALDSRWGPRGYKPPFEIEISVENF